MNQHLKKLGLLAGALMFGASVYAASDLPRVVVLATDPTALEGTTSGAFTLVRYGDTNSDLSVTVDIAGTATNGVDYTAIPSVLTIPAGFYAVDVPVQPIVGTTNTGNKTVILSLETNGTYRANINHKATVKIVDDVFDLPPPTLSLTSPQEGDVFTAPATITLQAEVSDPEVNITSVSFYANDEFLGSTTNSPFTLVWKYPATGTYALFSRATDEFKKSAVSEPVHITVSATPVVTLTSDAQIYLQGQQAQLQAQIGDPNEAISSVVFTVNNKTVATVTAAPFTYAWPATTVGNFNVEAIATDANTGKQGDSKKIKLTVTQRVLGN
jgi:hypothetical protein